MEIRNINGEVLLRFDAIPEGMKGTFSLSGEDYVTVPFSLAEPITFKIGDYLDLSEEVAGSTGFAKRYEIVSLQTPTYNKETGGYDYKLRFDAYYMKWQNKLFKYEPLTGGQETSWNLTAALDVHMGEFLKNLEALGYLFNGESYCFEIDDTVEDAAKLVTYDSTNLIDALTLMAETWECEWWVTEKTIHFGKCEHSDKVKLELDVEVQDMTRQESSGTFATRIYAFGAARNLPTNYRPVDETVVVNGVVQRRLMLPEDTPYIDAYRYKDGKKVFIGQDGYEDGEEMPEEEAIEAVVATDDIYPRTECVVGKVGTYTDTVEDEETGEKVTQTFYYVTDTSGLKFDEDYILEGEELMMKFESGLLNGMEFAVTFRKKGTTLKGETLTEDVYEIVANDDYGRTLPDEVLKPQEGDKFILFNWDSTKIESLGLIKEAEEELKEYATEYVQKTMIDDGTYTVTLMSDWVEKNQTERSFSVGQRVELINKSFFPDGRLSRVLGFEMKLDYPFDAPQYSVGESIAYSRLGNIEDKIDELTYRGSTYTSTSGGSGVYLIKRIDTTAATDTNAYSALRALMMFLRKDQTDETPYSLKVGGVLTMIEEALAKGGMQFGEEFITGFLGKCAQIDSKGYGEFQGLLVREFLEVPEIRCNRVSIYTGVNWITFGKGIVESVEIDTDGDGNELESGYINLKLEDGEIGMVEENDLCQGIFHNFENTDENDTENVDERNGNFHFAGFSTVYFRIDEVCEKDKDGNPISNKSRIHYVLRSESKTWTGKHHPQAYMNFACYANTENTSRQRCIYFTTDYMVGLRNMTDWEYGSENIHFILGLLDGFEIDGRKFSENETGTVIGNGYFFGTLQQITNAPYEIEIEVDGDSLVTEDEERKITCRVTHAFEYVDNDKIKWSVERESGNSEEDEKWNEEKNQNFTGELTITYQDVLGGDESAKSALFRFTAEITEDGDKKTVSKSTTFRAYVEAEEAIVIMATPENVVFTDEKNSLEVVLYAQRGSERLAIENLSVTKLDDNVSVSISTEKSDKSRVLTFSRIDSSISEGGFVNVTFKVDGAEYEKRIYVVSVKNGEEGEDAYLILATSDNVIFAEGELNAPDIYVMLYKGKEQVDMPDYQTDTGLKWTTSKPDGLTRNDFWQKSEGFYVNRIVLSRDTVERELSTDQTFQITLENGLVFTKTIHISTVFDGEQGEDAYILKSDCEVACFTESQNEVTFTLTPYKGSTQISARGYYRPSNAKIEGVTAKVTTNSDGTGTVTLTRDDPSATVEGTLRFGCEVDIANNDTMDIFCPVSVISQFNGKDAAGTSIDIEQTEIAIRSSGSDEHIYAWVYKNNEVYKISNSNVKVDTSQIPNGYPFLFNFEGVDEISGRIEFSYSCMVLSKSYPLDAIIPVTFTIDGVAYVRNFHMYTVFDGDASDKGDDAVVYELDCSVSTIKYQAAAGAFAPTSITASLYKVTGNYRATVEGNIDFYASYINDSSSERRIDGQSDVVSYTISLADHLGRYGNGFFTQIRISASAEGVALEKTIQIITSCTTRIQVWEKCADDFQFESGQIGETFYDFVYYTKNNTQYFFQCIKSHKKSAAEPVPGALTAYWQQVNTFDNIATGVILAQTGKIQNLYVDDVYMEMGNTAIWISPLFEGMKILNIAALGNDLGRENQVDSSGNVKSTWENPSAWFHGGNIPTKQGAFGGFVETSLTCPKSSGYFVDNDGTRVKTFWNDNILELGTITGLTKGNQLSISTDDLWKILFKEGTKLSGYTNSSLKIRIYFYWGSSTSAEHYLEASISLWEDLSEGTSVHIFIEKLAVKLDVEDESLRVVVCAYEGTLLPGAYVSFEENLIINFKETAYKQVSQYGSDGLMIGTSSESFLRLGMTSDKKDMTFELLGNSYGIMSEGEGLMQRTRGWDMPLGGTLLRAYIAPVSNVLNGVEKKSLWAYIWTFDGAKCSIAYGNTGSFTLYLPTEWVEKWGTFSPHKYVAHVTVCCKEERCVAHLWYNEAQDNTGRGQMQIEIFNSQSQSVDKPVYISVDLMGDYATGEAQQGGDAIQVSLLNKRRG